MNLDHLEKIQAVEAPPYLFTRIQQRIRNQQTNLVPKRLMWSMSLSFILILSLNIGVLFSSGQSNNAASSIVQEMNISAVNDLYK